MNYWLEYPTVQLLDLFQVFVLAHNGWILHIHISSALNGKLFDLCALWAQHGRALILIQTTFVSIWDTLPAQYEGWWNHNLIGLRNGLYDICGGSQPFVFRTYNQVWRLIHCIYLTSSGWLLILKRLYLSQRLLLIGGGKLEMTLSWILHIDHHIAFVSVSEIHVILYFIIQKCRILK